MKQAFKLVYTTCVVALLALPVQAQQWSPEQTEIWQLVSEQWESEKAGDLSWFAMLDASFQGWPIGTPTPYDKEAAKRFLTAEAGQSKILAYHIAPLAIIVTENTAVAHYYYTLITEEANGERENSVGRSTDVLTRTEDGWRYITWVGEERIDVDDH